MEKEEFLKKVRPKKYDTIDGRRGGNRAISNEEKKKVVQILALNDFNYAKTLKILESEGFKLTIPTLKKYRRQLADKIENLPAKYLENFEKNLAKRDQRIAELAYKMKEDVLNKLFEIIPNERNANTLVNIMNMLHNITTKAQEQGPVVYERAPGLIDQINDYLQKRNEQKNKSSGDIQDVPFEPVG